MPRANIYINNENWGDYEREENKSGLINRLLSMHYGQAIKKPSTARPTKLTKAEAEKVAKSDWGVPTSRRGRTESCPHGYAIGMCKSDVCNRKYAK